jgi:foldase protein PrsA
MKARAIIFYAAALLLLGAVFAWVVLNTQRGGSLGEETLYPSLVVARVDGVEILAEEVNKLVNLGDRGSASDRAEQRRLQREALDVLINRQLLINEGRRRNIEALPEEVEERLQKYFEMNGGEEFVRKQLTLRNQTLDQLRDEMRLSTLFDKISTAVEKEQEDKISVSEDEIESYYNENLQSRYTKMEIEYLFIEIRERDEEHKNKALELTEKILTELDKGLTFEDVEKKYADVDGVRVSTGRFKETDHVAEVLWKSAVELEVGEHTKEPIEFINSGYQILKCLSKRIIPLDEVRDSIRQRLSEMKLNQAVDEYFKSLRDKANIEVYLK